MGAVMSVAPTSMYPSVCVCACHCVSRMLCARRRSHRDSYRQPKSISKVERRVRTCCAYTLTDFRRMPSTNVYFNCYIPEQGTQNWFLSIYLFPELKYERPQSTEYYWIHTLHTPTDSLGSGLSSSLSLYPSHSVPLVCVKWRDAWDATWEVRHAKVYSKARKQFNRILVSKLLVVQSMFKHTSGSNSSVAHHPENFDSIHLQSSCVVAIEVLPTAMNLIHCKTFRQYDYYKSNKTEIVNGYECKHSMANPYECRITACNAM